MNSIYQTINVLLLALGIVVLSGCSSPATTSDYDQTVDFSKFSTFSFVADLATDKKEFQSLETTHLKNAVGRELEALGMRQVQVDPDLAFNFSIETQEKIQSRTVPQTSYGMGYDPFYNAYYDGWRTSHTTRIDQYTEGKLNIDAIDVKAQKIVWHGSTKGRLTRKDMENFRATLEAAVAEIFEQLKDDR